MSIFVLFDRISQLSDNLDAETCGNTSPASTCLQDKIVRLKSCTKKESECVKWVNSIMRSHKAATLKELRICCDLSLSAKKAITRWLQMAFVRHVQRLELDLDLDLDLTEYFLTDLGPRAKTYVFPNQELLTHKRRLDFNALKELSLKEVDVCGETIEFLLLNCLSLEKLVIEYSLILLNLQVGGPSLMLKHLEIITCFNFKSIKVYSAPKLTKLIIPIVEELLLENVPMLVEVSNDDSEPYEFCVSNLLRRLSLASFSNWSFLPWR